MEWAIPIPLDMKNKLNLLDFSLELNASRHLNDLCFLQVAGQLWISKKMHLIGEDYEAT